MSSFPNHIDNVKDLEKLGLDVSDYVENGEATYDSWGYDSQVDLVRDIIYKLREKGVDFK